MHADVLICSHPRSGGRWLRYLLAHYLAAHHRLDITITPPTVFCLVPDHHDEPSRGYPALLHRDRPGLPVAAVCHHPYSWEYHRGYPLVFLARNAYDVVVSAYFHLSHEKGEYIGTMRDFIRHPKVGLGSWTRYMNSWAPHLLTHRDALLLSYRALEAEPAHTLARVLAFLDHEADPALVQAAVDSADALRRGRGIRTGQEGNFWDHLQPDEIFDIHEALYRDLTEPALRLLEQVGVDVDPFPRASS